MNELIVNFILYFVLFVYAYRKFGFFNIYTTLILWYAFVACVGLYIVFTGIFNDTYGMVFNAKIVFLPFLFCFICNLILFYPYYKFVRSGETLVSLDSYNYFDKFINVSVCIIVIYGVFRLIDLHNVFTLDFASHYLNSHYEGARNSVYQGGMAFILSIFTLLYMVLSPFVISYCFLKFIDSKENIKFLILLLIAIIPNFAYRLSNASRGGLFFIVSDVLFFLLIFRKYLPVHVVKNIKIVLVTICVFFLSLALLITSSRYENSTNTAFESIARYFGEPFPVLGYLTWDKVKLHPAGARLFSEVYSKFFNAPSFSSVGESWDYYGYITGAPIMNWKTLFGDLYIEFGLLGTFGFVFGLVFLFSKIITNKGLNFYYIPILYYYYQLIVGGVINFTKGSAIDFYVLFLIFIISHYFEKKARSNSHNL